MRGFLGALGVGIALFSGLFVVMAIGDLIGGSDTETGVLIALLVFFTGTTAAGVYMAKRHLIDVAREEAANSRRAREQAVLEVAAGSGGTVTVAEIAAGTGWGISETRELMGELAREGIAESDVNERGELLYVFRGVGGLES